MSQRTWLTDMVPKHLRLLVPPSLIFLLSLLAVFEPFPLLHGATNWSSPLLVDSHLGIDILPSALQASNNTLWLAWESNRNAQTTGRYDILYKTYTNGVWSIDRNLTSSGNNAAPSIVQLPNGTITVFWTMKPAASYEVFYKSFIGNMWASPVQVTTTTLNDTLNSVAVDRDGTVWLVWTQVDSSCKSCPAIKQLYYKTWKSGIWSPDVQLTTDSNQNYGASVLVSNDGIVRVAWSKGQASNVFQIYYKTYDGTMWSSESQIVSSSSTDEHPSLIQDRNGTLWMFWGRLVVVSPLVQYYVLLGKYSYDLGKTWSSEIQLSNTSTSVDSRMPAAVQSSTGVRPLWVFYSSNLNEPDPDIYAVTSSGISPVHHVVVSAFKVSNNLQYPGGMASVSQSPFVTVTVMISDIGDYSETVTVTLSIANKTVISLGSLNGPVNPGNIQNFYYYWNTTGVTPGRYSLSATLAPVPGESLGNTGDNSLSQSNQVHILPFGDIDQDGSVTITDVSVFFYDYNFTPGCNCPRWNPYADLNNDGIINLLDLSVAARNYGIFT